MTIAKGKIKKERNIPHGNGIAFIHVSHLDPGNVSMLSKIFIILHAKTGQDFSLYKQKIIRNRIERRMAAHNIDSYETYVRFLEVNVTEVHLLFKELLINVTSFFRDKEAFAALKQEALPLLFLNKPQDHLFRVWIAGCATGEEAYSIAILLREYMDEIQKEYKVQIYSTDIDEDVIEIARTGVYPANITIDITRERLRRFFVREETGFRITKEIRGMSIFAIQNVINDPPFTKMDLISCRNLLIYLEPELQNQVISSFHYAIKPGGILFLSPSESIGNYQDNYSPLNKKWKIYTAKNEPASTRELVSERFSWVRHPKKRGDSDNAKKGTEASIAELMEKALISAYAPPSVITDLKGMILYIQGDTGKYLQPAQGLASLNIIEMARTGLAIELNTAIHTSSTQKTQVDFHNLHVQTNEGFHDVDLIVRPIIGQSAEQELLLVSFSDTKQVIPEKTRRRKQSVLKVSQQRIEELETSKEELQSVNEELITVNAELRAKIEQLAGIQNDLKNLMENMNVGTIFLDENLTIKRFTHEATQVFRLVASDTGRSLADIRSVIVKEDLITDSQIVLDTLIPREKQVITLDNEWYLVRIMPYRTLENVIEGVVLTFNNITELHKTAAEAKFAMEDITTNNE